MLLDAPSVPDAPSVGHNAIEAAKPLLLLGWIDVACLAARVALERRLQRIATRDNCCVRIHRSTFCDLVGGLQHAGKLSGAERRAVRFAHSKLSRAGHGAGLAMAQAVELIEDTDAALASLKW